MNHIVCHYGELALKGGNRDFFEKRLVENIKFQLEKYAPGMALKTERRFGRIIIKLSEKSSENHKPAENTLKNVFGLVSFSFADKTKQDIEEIKKSSLKMLKGKDFKTFRITTKRSRKDFPLTSEQVNREVGAFIIEKLGKKVKLKDPDETCYVEIAENYALVYSEKIKCLGGMPVGTSGKAVALLSGGFDSPVAAFYALKRGLSTSFVHFHSAPYTSKESMNKVRSLAKNLEKFGSKGKVFMVPFADMQKEVMMKAPEKLRVILYRRMMMKISERIAKREKARALVTGDSLAQVASQTIENLSVVSQSINMLIIRPLIGFDKEEIIQKAKEIGTYDISVQPHDDCCTRFMPKKPEIRARIEEVLKAEDTINMKNLIKKSLEKTETVNL